MNRKELIAVVAEECGMKRKDTEAVVDTVIEKITDTLAKGDKVSISGFGTFSKKSRNAKIFYNPKTNKKTEVPSSYAVIFKTGKNLKNIVKDIKNAAE